jgi:multidrug efflux system membrane fusion protein
MVALQLHTLAGLARRRQHGAPAFAARLLSLVLALTLSSAGVLGGCSSDSGGAAPATGPQDAVPVNVATAVEKDVPVQVGAIGNVEAYSTVAVKTQIDGALAQINFKEGQEVAEGALLFVIDPRPFQAALAQAQANLAKNRAEATNAQVQAERYARLLAPGFISKDQYDQVRTQAAAFEAAAAADLAAVENVKLQLQYCYIHSPITGRIGQYLVHAGNVVKSKDTILAVINQLRPVFASFAVPEQQLPAIRMSAAARELKVEAFAGNDSTHAAAGELKFIDNAVDTKTGTVMLKGLFANEDETLWPGQFVNVALTLSIQPHALLVPATAIQNGQQGHYVFVVTKDAVAEVRPVVTGQTVDQQVVVEKGLRPGETVVTRGQIRLAAGSKVQIKTDLGGDAPQQPPAS